MSRETSTIEITPKVIDLGASIVPLANVSRAGMVVVHPLQAAGLWLLVVAGLLLAFEASPFGSGLRFPPRPSVLLWSVCGIAALGVFMLAYARRRLMIITADGARIGLGSADAQFAAAVTNCIREAIEHGAGGATHYRIDLAQKTIATLAVAMPATAPGAVPYGAPPAGNPIELPREQLGGPTGRPAATAPAGKPGPPPRGGPGAMPGLAGPMTAPNGAPHGGLFGLAREATGPPAGVAAQAGNGAYRNGSHEAQPFELAKRLDGLVAGTGQAASALGTAGGFSGAGAGSLPAGIKPVYVPPLAAPDDGGLRDLAALMQVVERANVQHKEALLDLLRVVEDHKRGGATSRDDAKAHWQSFAEYVQQYLATVEGLPEATQRFGRAMAQEPGFRL